ncbi:MAG: nuclear transport factor 2 family protein [Pseudomonadota bacterium]|nr:nuclear transport factor 2 family protein [Pseudomonadota bacterium]
MPHPAPEAFVQAWVDAWNAHDVEGVLAHFHDDAAFSSPFARMVFADSDGVFRGKPAIRRYWQTALAMIPDLKFVVQRFFVGVDTIVIEYRNHRGLIVNEVLIFDGDRVRQGFGTYPPESIPAKQETAHGD